MSEVDAALMAWRDSRGEALEKRMTAVVVAVRRAAWTPLGRDVVVFEDDAPVLAWFPAGGRRESARVAVVERFDGWIPAPALWMRVPVPDPRLLRAVRAALLEPPSPIVGVVAT